MRSIDRAGVAMGGLYLSRSLLVHTNSKHSSDNGVPYSTNTHQGVQGGGGNVLSVSGKYVIPQPEGFVIERVVQVNIVLREKYSTKLRSTNNPSISC